MTGSGSGSVGVNLNRKIVHLYNFFIYLRADVNPFTLCYDPGGKGSFVSSGLAGSLYFFLGASC